MLLDEVEQDVFRPEIEIIGLAVLLLAVGLFRLLPLLRRLIGVDQSDDDGLALRERFVGDLERRRRLQRGYQQVEKALMPAPEGVHELGASCSTAVDGLHGLLYSHRHVAPCLGRVPIEFFLVGVQALHLDLVVDAAIAQGPRDVLAGGLQLAGDQLHRRDAALADLTHELGEPGREWRTRAPEAQPLEVAHVDDVSSRGGREKHLAHVRQLLAQLECLGADLAHGRAARRDGVLHRVRLVPGDVGGFAFVCARKPLLHERHHLVALRVLRAQ